ncbi:uncharacterized protein LOC118373717 isoform X2 [Oncorhynchus keta]|uniref:uncharacterized protein LOC118373717 isoform X2 n=1 Tax=Oncorhynchus keta TaxID=8018 RepID=UPI00227CEACA|nr:uncharacterized protein LOC118373717 isoform X2 [Oncorhynchus keta]
MASVKESSQTLRLNIITKDIEEEVKIWECDDYAEESPEMTSVKMADSSQTLGLNVTFKEEEKDDFGESDHGLFKVFKAISGEFDISLGSETGCWKKKEEFGES